MIHNLADILAPRDVPFFLKHFETKVRFLLRAEAPGRAETLLPWAEIDRLLSTTAMPYEAMRVMVNGNVTDPRMYRDKGYGAIRLNALAALARQGATCVINGIQNHVPAVDALVASMERTLGCPVWANCYLSFGRHTGFLTHFDAHDVLILQVWGAKRWRTYGTPVPCPVEGMTPPMPDEPVWEDVLRSGDVLYVPRGEYHAAVPEAPPSVHLTIGMIPARGMTFMQWLGENARDSVALRADIVRDPHGCASNESAIKQALHELIDRTPVSDFLASDDRKRPLRRIAAFGASGRWTAQTMLVSALRRRLDLETGVDESLEVEIGGDTVRLSSLARQSLEVITERDRITLGELAALLGWQAADEQLTGSLDELARNVLIAVENP